MTDPSTHDPGGTLLRVWACLTVASAPVEGYLTAVHPHLAKAPALILGITWTVVRAGQRRPPTPHPLHVVLALLAVVLLMTSAAHAGEPFTAQYLVRWLPFLAVTVVIADLAAREVPLRDLLAAAVGGAVIAAVGGLVGMVEQGWTRASGPLEDPNDLAYFLVAALPLVITLLPGATPSRGRRLLVGLAAGVLVLGTVATLSRGGALALGAAVLWLLLRRVLRVRVLAGAVLACGVLVAGLAMDERAIEALREKAFIAGTNVDTRELRWAAAGRMLADSPVLGVGPGGFRGAYAATSHNAELDEQVPVAHEMYLEVGAELGVVGLALFLVLIGLTAVLSERVLRAGGDRRLVVAVQASLLAVLVASTFLSQQYYLPLWFLAALVCAADLRVRSGRKGEGPCVSFR
ncbi:O-antigen ligase family protein [Actinokineospora sp. 24-640]